MKRVLHHSLILTAVLGSAQVFGQIVYDNTGSWSAYYPTAVNVNTDEYGDEINLLGGANTIQTVVLEYGASSLSGDETVRIRLYANDGPLNDQNAHTPGTTPLYESGDLAITTLNGRGTLTLNNLNVAVPGTLIWTVQFSGVTTGESVGIGINGPPSVGTSFNDYWERNGGTWELYQFTNPPQPGSFAAQITAVPEPAAYAMVVGVGLLGFAVFRRHSLARLQ